MNLSSISKRRTKAQGGFTLIELAIVLVIIGLLLGGMLKGQELIKNAQAKKGVSDFQEIAAAMYTYQDRYGVLPGTDGDTRFDDDVENTGRWGFVNTGVLRTTEGSNGAGVLRILMAAGILSGDPEDGGPLNNSFGGNMGVTRTACGGNLNGNIICSSLIPGFAAQQIVRQLDNAQPDSGSIMAIESNSSTQRIDTAPADEWDEDATYTLCYAF